jgi:hypothetical protein
MAYTFNGSTQYLRATSQSWGITAWPMTLYARGKSSDLTNNQVVATFMQEGSPYNGFQLLFAGANASDPMNVGTFGVVGIDSSVSYSDGAWHSFAQRRASNTVFDVDADGTVDTGATTSATFPSSPGAGGVNIGARLTPSFSLGLTGAAACVAMWSAALTDAEMASLVAGFSPRRVRPQSLRFYAPIVRELQVIAHQLTVAPALTATASPTVSDHPRSYGF